GEPATASDKVPATLQLDQLGGIDPASVRTLGTQAGTAYWTGLDRSGKGCLIPQSTRHRSLSASSCVLPSDLEVTGGALRIDGVGWSLEAFLVPDSVDAAAAPAGWTAVSDNLVVNSASALSARITSTLALPRDSGAPLTLTRLTPPQVG